MPACWSRLLAIFSDKVQRVTSLYTEAVCYQAYPNQAQSKKSNISPIVFFYHSSAYIYAQVVLVVHSTKVTAGSLYNTFACAAIEH